jgi:hypothetical protein
MIHAHCIDVRLSCSVWFSRSSVRQLLAWVCVWVCVVLISHAMTNGPDYVNMILSGLSTTVPWYTLPHTFGIYLHGYGLWDLQFGQCCLFRYALEVRAEKRVVLEGSRFDQWCMYGLQWMSEGKDVCCQFSVKYAKGCEHVVHMYFGMIQAARKISWVWVRVWAWEWASFSPGEATETFYIHVQFTCTLFICSMCKMVGCETNSSVWWEEACETQGGGGGGRLKPWYVSIKVWASVCNMQQACTVAHNLWWTGHVVRSYVAIHRKGVVGLLWENLMVVRPSD